MTAPYRSRKTQLGIIVHQSRIRLWSTGVANGGDTVLMLDV